MARRQGETSFNEARNQRLRVLADSVNDTARMARTTITIFLLLALYLALTLFSVTDETLLREGPVSLPQVNIGFPVVQSYIAAPIVYLFLHAHALFVLCTLARKVRTFEVAMNEEINATKGQNTRTTKKREYRDWLSSFVFVQIFQEDVSASNVARQLTWLATSAIPLTVLFVIDISFIRHQSHGITWFHHCIFLLDLGLVVLFHWEAFGRRIVKTPKRIETHVKGLAAGIMVLVLLFAAYPPSEDDIAQAIWCFQDGKSNESKDGDNEEKKGKEDEKSCSWNLLDRGCIWLRERVRISCRYLEVNKFKPKINEKLQFTERNLRFARFGSAELTNVDFSSSQLQNAKFEGAMLENANFSGEKTQLQGADFWKANLQGANLSEAQLQGAVFWEAQLQGAVLGRAQLQGADLSEAQLQGAVFWGAQLQGANLSEAQLQGAVLSEAQLQGAVFGGAQLQGARLSEAQLQGTNLSEAQLQGADLSEAQLQWADLQDTDFEGTNLQNASLQCVFGEPVTWRLAWMPGAQFNFSSSTNQQSACSFLPSKIDQCLQEIIPEEMPKIKLSWDKSRTLKDYLKQKLNDCPTQVFDGAKPKKEDLVFYDRKARSSLLIDWPEPVDIESPIYLNAWRKWTLKFACQNARNAHTSFERWLEDSMSFKDKISADARRTVLKALIDNREKKEECPGIAAIQDEEWKNILEQWKNLNEAGG